MQVRAIPPPDDFADEARRLWFATQRQLRRQGTWQDQDAVLLESYCRAVTLARSARLEADREPFVPGSRGQVVAHPGHRVAAEAERDACRFAEALLLTPQVRARHGITAEQADRLEAALA